MQGPSAERFVVFNLRLLALSFAVVGILFIAFPNGVVDAITDVGDWLGRFPDPPATGVRLWLALGFAYMVVIAAICVVAQLDVVRYRALMLVLALGKAASSLSALGFFVFTQDAFVYLLNFIVDGLLVLAALWLWSLAGRVGRPADPG